MDARRKVVSRLLPAPLVAAVALSLPAAAAASGAARDSSQASTPTPAQIQTAVRRAEASPNLWATVNVCNTRRHPGVIGIRAQMPALGFAVTLRMRFQVDYWSPGAKRFKPVPGASRPVTVGVEKTGLHQEGVQFSFPRHTGSLRGTVRFQWNQGRQPLGHHTEDTTPGHRDADFGDPAHYSAGRCLIS